jgi:tetratricopeptide (TPR) repeat protein
MAETTVIRTPDQRVRVFVSSTLQELAPEREAVRAAVTRLRLVPVMFELGARAHPPRRVYRDYLAQSQIFIGVYWQSYGWVAPDVATSGLEDEYLLSAGLPRLVYVKAPAPQREPRLAEMLAKQAAKAVEALGSLVDNSMVQPQARDGEPRFRLLETIREYALERLRESAADWRDVHARHAAYYAALAQPAEAELQGIGQLAWLQRLEAEHGNLVAAMAWLTDQDPPDPAVRLAWATWRFWWLQGHADEMARFSRRVLAKSAHFARHQRALTLAFGAFESLASGDPDRAQALFEQSLPLFRQTGDTVRTALNASVLGRLLALQHQDARASDLLHQSQALLRDLGTDQLTGPDRFQQLVGIAFACDFLGQIRLGQGDDHAATRLFTRALAAARCASDRITILVSLYNLAASSQAAGDQGGAATHLIEGLSLAAEAGDDTSAAYYLEGLAVMAVPQNNPVRAVHLLAAARALLEANGSGWLHAFLPPGAPGDEVRAELRQRLGGQAFEAACAYGRSIAGSGAVEYALNSMGDN